MSRRGTEQGDSESVNLLEIHRNFEDAMKLGEQCQVNFT